MTYKKNFVCAIKVNGNILRESSDRVELPFGSEYSVLLKNLDSVRVQARISIDGKNATDWLVINPGQDVDVERFVEDLDKGNRFKFIEFTEKIEKNRGVKAEDGLVRVEFKREKVYEPIKTVEHHTYHHNYYRYYPYTYPLIYNAPIMTFTSGSIQGQQNTGITRGVSGSSNTSCSVGSIGACSINNAGITVPGSISQQKFVSVSGFETEKSEVIVLHLVGKKQDKLVKTAKTVKTKLSCETCGKKNKSNMKFCSECGTSLEKI